MEKEEKTLVKATVCIPIKKDKIILAMKTRNIGIGCLNGAGGGVEEGETIVECAIRELEEEFGLKAKMEDLEKVAIVDFHNEKSDGSIFVSQVHFFLVRKWYRVYFFFIKKLFGKARETKDGAMIDPTFFDIDHLPYGNMMPADKAFFPLILKGKKVLVEAHYTPFQKELKREVIIKEVNEFPEE